MFYQQIEKINSDIDRTRKAIITLGCSFTQGQGAVDDSLYEEYDWHFERVGVPIAPIVTPSQQQEILKKYPNVNIAFDKLDFTFMEYDNAFGNVLCSKYFNNEYACINFGNRGCGNRATIKELYFHPELHWHNLDEIIVIYCPSGFERLDLVNDNWFSHNHWVCTWPHYKDVVPGPRKLLSEGYAKRVHSTKFEIIEQISHVQELLTWCKEKNAKLIITPAFDRRYTRGHFSSNLFDSYGRDIEGNLNVVTKESNPDPRVMSELKRLLNLWPWEKHFFPDNFPTFADLCMGQEFPDDWESRHFFHYNGIFSPNKWITSCAHPSAKGHDLFAKKLYEHIQKEIL